MNTLILTAHATLSIFTLVYAFFMYLYMRALRTTQRQIDLAPPPIISKYARLCAVLIGASLLFNIMAAVSIITFASMS